MQLRKLSTCLGLALLLIGAIGIWRAAHPPLTPRQQILANIENLRRELQARSVRGVLGNLTDDFTWNDMARADFVNLLKSAFFSARDVRLDISAVSVDVQGAQATVTGHFAASYRESPDSPVENKQGDFGLHCVRESNRQWKIDRVTGGQNIS